MPNPGDEAAEPIEVPPAYEIVLQRLRRAIHLGVYLPGEKLPPERVHSAQLGVSRVTLREAVRVLEGEGYVETRRGSSGGVVVLPRRESLDAARQRVQAMLPELEGISDFRLANERCAAERAAVRVSDDDLAYLQGTIDALRESDSIDTFRRADSRFHLRIAAVADCALLRDAVEDGRAAMFLPLDVLDFELMLTTSARAHRRILAALRERSPDKAGRAMAAHIRTTWDELRAGVRTPAGP